MWRAALATAMPTPVLHVPRYCESGHYLGDVDARQAANAPPGCGECGVAALAACPACGEHFASKLGEGGVYDLSGRDTLPDNYCIHCREPFPWTVAALEALEELAGELENLKPGQADLLVRSLPDLLAQTPRTEVAVVRLKKILATAAGDARAAIVSLLLQHGVAVVRTAVGS